MYPMASSGGHEGLGMIDARCSFGHISQLSAQWVGMFVDHIDAFRDQFLDILEEWFFLQGTEGEGVTAGSGTTCAADTVYIGLRYFGQLIVDHMGEVIDVDTPCGNISCHKDAGRAAFKITQCILPGTLGFIAMDRFSLDALFGQELAQFIRTVFGPGKDQGRFDAIIIQHVFEQEGLVFLLGEKHGLVDGLGGRRYRGNFHFYRIVQEGVGQGVNFRWHGGREKQGLLFLGKFGDDAFDIMYKSHVQHPVGFIKDKVADVFQADQSLVHQVQESARGSDQDIYAFAELIDLVDLGDAAEYDSVAEVQVAAIRFKALFDLDREFARRGEYKGMNGARAFGGVLEFFMHQLQQWDRKSGGLSGAGLGAAPEILAFEDGRDGLLLNGGWGGVPFMV